MFNPQRSLPWGIFSPPLLRGVLKKRGFPPRGTPQFFLLSRPGGGLPTNNPSLLRGKQKPGVKTPPGALGPTLRAHPVGAPPKVGPPFRGKTRSNPKGPLTKGFSPSPSKNPPMPPHRGPGFRYRANLKKTLKKPFSRAISAILGILFWLLKDPPQPCQGLNL